MKKSILILALIISTIEINAQSNSNYKTEIFFDFSLLYWDNFDIAESYGSMPLVGLGLAKPFSDDFKFYSEAEIGKDNAYETDLYYQKLEFGIQYSLADFSYQKATVYGGIGALGIWIKAEDSDEDYLEKGHSPGFSARLGVLIPLQEGLCIDINWNSVWSDMNIDNDNLNVGSQICSAGLLFTF